MNIHKHLILLVDDDKDFRELLSLRLRSLGFMIIEAGNGKEALDKLGASDPVPDLVILDFKMPVMDGVKALDEIKSDSKFNKVKVIFLTNYGETNEEFKKTDKILAEDLGAANYIRKTDDLDMIVLDIENAIHGI